MKLQLQKRLVQFAAQIVAVDKQLKPCFASRHLYTQILRSATSAALNYGEAQTAESRKDFIHKLGVVLKELKETEVNLEVIVEAKLFKQEQIFIDSLKECKELIAIFAATRKTAKSHDEGE
jgi:four helix bundle protein